MIIFENPGEIDPRLISLMGVNVKPTPSAIGFFGTGLKYSIACLLRWNESITIQSGEAVFDFQPEEASIRGQQFQIINMVGRHDRASLGFTTDLGKRWEPWMVYRELWCNTQDEGGSVYEGTAPPPKAGLTRVIVSGPKIEEAHATRSQFILEEAPTWATPGLEIHNLPGTKIFYRGIAVQSLEKPSLFTYNITEQLYLTEDRTASSWSTDPAIAGGVTQLEDRAIIEEILLASQDHFESRLDYAYCEPGPLWLAAAEELVKGRSAGDLHGSVRRRFAQEALKRCPTCGQIMSGGVP